MAPIIYTIILLMMAYVMLGGIFPLIESIFIAHLSHMNGPESWMALRT